MYLDTQCKFRVEAKVKDTRHIPLTDFSDPPKRDSEKSRGRRVQSDDREDAVDDEPRSRDALCSRVDTVADERLCDTTMQGRMSCF
jgi:hypothetical protein